MPKPTFVCLHGTWHSPACFNDLSKVLAAHDYTCVCPALPSTGGDPPTYDFTEDVDIIRSVVTELVEKEQDVIVVMHSYSGIPGGQALENLDKKSCEVKGFKGGVVRLVFIMAFLVPEGFQHSPRGTRDNMVLAMKTDMEAGIVTCIPEEAKALMYQDLPDDTAAKWVAELRPQSLGVYWSTTTFAAWRCIPTTYIVCLKDVPSTVAVVDGMLSSLKATDNRKIDNIVRQEVGHSAFLSQPEWTAEMLREAADEKMA